MKKLLLSIFACVTLLAANAQTQRKKTKVTTDSTTTIIAAKNRSQKKEMMKELNLTREQKGKLKELRRLNKAKIAEVQNNDKQTETQKKEQLKALKKEQLKATLAVLNDEQKAKLKAQQKNKRNRDEVIPLMEEEQ